MQLDFRFDALSAFDQERRADGYTLEFEPNPGPQLAVTVQARHRPANVVQARHGPGPQPRI